MIRASLTTLLLVLPPSAQDPAEDVASALARLDAARPGQVPVLVEELAPRGEPLGLAALATFGEATQAARRARASLLLALQAPGTLQGLLTIVVDEPDPVVRALVAEALGTRAFAAILAGERVEALVAVLERDPSHEVRAVALEALRTAALPGTAARLDGALTALPPAEAAEVARVFVELPRSGARVIARVVAAFTGQQALPEAVLVELVRGYGRALAEVPNGGSDPAERLPFLRGRLHPDAGVRLAAVRALTAHLDRLFELGEEPRAERVLAALEREGLPPEDALYRRVKIALARLGDAERALELARRLEGASALAAVEARATFRFYALHYQGAALFGLGRLDEAQGRFEAAAAVVVRLLEERLDLETGGVTGFFDFGGSGTAQVGLGLMIDRLELLGLERLWVLATEIARDPDAGGTPAGLELARSAHELVLQARVLWASSEANAGNPSFDSLLDRDLAPGPLVVNDRRLERWNDGRGHAVLASLGRALATVAPAEVPGFDAYPLDLRTPGVRRLVDPLFDPARAALYRSNRDERGFALERRFRDYLARVRAAGAGWPDPGDEEFQRIELERRALARMIAEEEERAHGIDPAALTPEELAEIRHTSLDLASEPSLFALTLATGLRNDGSIEAGRELAQALLEDLGAGMPGASTLFLEWASARTELLIGSTWMDESRPREAESACQSAVRRLEEVETSLLENGADPESNGTVRMLRDLRANALLSLAVNANVRMNDEERALEYFERAFELDQRDFMQALLACYRARSGREEEARAVLDSLTPSPALYYNLACTHALLGDSREAVDYLAREFQENHPTRSSLERQKSWAREDPDLASLRDDPGFRRLVGLE